MTRFKLVIATLVSAAAIVSAVPMAQARSSWSFGINTGPAYGGYYSGAPVAYYPGYYYAPTPVYYAPAPAYYSPFYWPSFSFGYFGGGGGWRGGCGGGWNGGGHGGGGGHHGR